MDENEKRFVRQMSCLLSIDYPIDDKAINGDAEVFFVVNKIDDKEFIKKCANNLLDNGARNFNFTGKYRNLWELIFDDVDIERHPDGEYSDGIALTSCWEKRKGFEDAIEISDKDNIFLFYDTEEYPSEVDKA